MFCSAARPQIQIANTTNLFSRLLLLLPALVATPPAAIAASLKLPALRQAPLALFPLRADHAIGPLRLHTAGKKKHALLSTPRLRYVAQVQKGREGEGSTEK